LRRMLAAESERSSRLFRHWRTCARVTRRRSAGVSMAVNRMKSPTSSR
jgi:hypothetical protein